jgi:hypothetical protein
MIKVSIYKNNVLCNEAKFTTDDLANAWVEQEINNQSFGRNERWLVESEFTDEVIEQSLESRIRNGLGNLLEYKFSADYTIQISDISIEELARQESSEAVRYLSETDWYIIREMDSGEQCPNDIKLARAAARLKVL